MEHAASNCMALLAFATFEGSDDALPFNVLLLAPAIAVRPAVLFDPLVDVPTLLLIEGLLPTPPLKEACRGEALVLPESKEGGKPANKLGGNMLRRVCCSCNWAAERFVDVGFVSGGPRPFPVEEELE